MADFPWFRLYSNDILSDRKLARVCRTTGTCKAIVRGVWLTLMAMANDSPERGRLLISGDLPVTEEEIREDVGLDGPTFSAIMAEFAELQMIERGTCIVLCNFAKRNPPSDSSVARVRKYRERRKASGLPAAGTYDTHAIIQRDGGQCVYCSSRENLCVDHILPVAQNGTDDPRNLACACKKCNSGKSGRTPEQAGYKILNVAVTSRYRDYLKDVTVTETGGNCVSNGIESESESESESDPESEEESAAIAPSAAADSPISFSTFPQWQEHIRASKGQSGGSQAAIRRMTDVLYPGLDPPDYAYIAKTARKVGGFGRLADLLWQHSSRPPTGDLLAYVQGVAKNGNRNNGRRESEPVEQAIGWVDE